MNDNKEYEKKSHNSHMKINYQLELDKIIKKVTQGDFGDSLGKKLLLHSCCGPCSSYVLEYLTQYFDVTVLYYNPCIYPLEEYAHRKSVQQDLIFKMNETFEHRDLIENSSNKMRSKIEMIDCDYDHDSFLELVKGHENDPECGNRCHICYRQRLERASEVARANNFNWFTTTLTVSPYKNAEVLNAIGLDISSKTGVPYLVSDFKKREGYKRSIELSKVYSLYRQDYCGCEFSLPKN